METITTLCSSGALGAKAGAFVSTALDSNTDYNAFLIEAEGEFCAATNYDWVTNAASITANTSGAIVAAISAKAAMKAIQYDMSGFPSQRMAETQLDVLGDEYSAVVARLREVAIRKKVSGATE